VNQGGFLQVSHGREWLKKQDQENFRIAFPTYLLQNDKDGYQALLSKCWQVPKDELLERFTGKSEKSFSLISLIVQGVNKPSVTYCDDARLRPDDETSEKEFWLTRFIILCRDYEHACDEAMVSLNDRRLLLSGHEENIEVVIDQAIRDIRNKITSCMFVYWRRFGRVRDFEVMAKTLVRSRERWELGIPLHDYMADAMTPVVVYIQKKISELEPGDPDSD
jgi:hypothetical protein